MNKVIVCLLREPASSPERFFNNSLLRKLPAPMRGHWQVLHFQWRILTRNLACVAWRFWLGALSNKGGREQRNREEIGAEATWFLFFSRLRRSFSRASRANFVATPLLRPARQNRHATQATRNLDESTPEPTIRSCGIGQWISCFDICQLSTSLIAVSDTREKRSAHACRPCFRREFASACPNRNYTRYQNTLDSGREIQKSKLHTQKSSLEFHEHKVY